MPALKEKELQVNITVIYGKLVKLFKINLVFNSEVLLWKGLLRKMKSIYTGGVKTGKVEALQEEA